jgi:hypothetical protein
VKKKVSALRKTVQRVQSRGYAVKFSADRPGARRVIATKTIGRRTVALKFNVAHGTGRSGARSGLGIQTSTPSGAYRARFVTSLSKIRRDRRGRFAHK